ncbi:hypothetical protein Taro_035541 [Colocasia esculenta]|uniref:Uncharacterized protein n=1 Tax=Colocasia esculenta TaxID=4460 RepID=A0A843W6Z0_COLES|nr:hypothetical protein [Colocasia esculenta]
MWEAKDEQHHLQPLGGKEGCFWMAGILGRGAGCGAAVEPWGPMEDSTLLLWQRRHLCPQQLLRAPPPVRSRCHSGPRLAPLSSMVEDAAAPVPLFPLPQPNSDAPPAPEQKERPFCRRRGEVQRLIWRGVGRLCIPAVTTEPRTQSAASFYCQTPGKPSTEEEALETAEPAIYLQFLFCSVF